MNLIHIYGMAIQDDSESRFGWMCPDATAEIKIQKKIGEVKEYIFKALTQSHDNGDRFIFAPFFEEYVYT